MKKARWQVFIAIPPDLALIDQTLEALEADEPDWDMPWWCNSSPLPTVLLPTSLAPSSQPSPSSLPVSSWPEGLTVACMLDAYLTMNHLRSLHNDALRWSLEKIGIPMCSFFITTFGKQCQRKI
ncbi:hypothetical protein BT96DRAFT_983357 [Gymnopus androsaceus JB14]|uniref:Uncharacterized protein n=1 Tax=Gymnopus androsaceus JB14 TaxID=1447944 RepID=A0A6A4IL99_9AGAR|nr:hypothetical protein BT96DRAFT_983357 [Gymnopus androsaceus JB14]